LDGDSRAHWYVLNAQSIGNHNLSASQGWLTRDRIADGKKFIAPLSIQQLTAKHFALISDEAVSSALLAFLTALMFDDHTSQRSVWCRRKIRRRPECG
jgi:hypothetical protein